MDTTVPSDISDANLKDDTVVTDLVNTLGFEKGGKAASVLIPFGYSGQVLLHTLHGAFIEESAM